MNYELITTDELCQLISVSKSYLRDRRVQEDWKQGTHWVYLNAQNPQGGIRYNKQLCSTLADL